jgi:hypothetical protein
MWLPVDDDDDACSYFSSPLHIPWEQGGNCFLSLRKKVVITA